MEKLRGESCPRYQVLRNLKKASGLSWLSFFQVRHERAKLSEGCTGRTKKV